MEWYTLVVNQLTPPLKGTNFEWLLQVPSLPVIPHVCIIHNGSYKIFQQFFYSECSLNYVSISP